MSNETRDGTNLAAEEALERLREGNERFATTERTPGPLHDRDRMSALLQGQHPFAVILGCADSRVPAEIVFDQGLGELFVIRVAGNIVAPSLIGSVEFAAVEFGTRLVVVLGHSHCGAVRATIDELRQPAGAGSKNLRSIVDRVRPAVAPLLATDFANDPERLENEAVRANVRASVEQLRAGSEILEQFIDDDGLMIVGAEYWLESGRVEFLE